MLEVIGVGADLGRIKIGRWSDVCMLVDDPPMALLCAFDYVKSTHKPVAVEFDSGSYKYIIIFELHKTHIITNQFDDFESSYHSEKISLNENMKDYLKDLRRDIDHWCKIGCENGVNVLIL